MAWFSIGQGGLYERPGQYAFVPDTGQAPAIRQPGVMMKWNDGHGNSCRARETVVADTLTQYCDAGSGGSAFQYVVEDGGQRLRMIAHITSPHLGGPVDYTIEMHRDSVQGAAP